MENVSETLGFLVVAVGPFLGYTLALRRTARTRAQLILAAALGSAVPAAVACAAAASLGVPTSELLPWALVAAAYGFTVGLLGVLARIVGAWLGRRQP